MSNFDERLDELRRKVQDIFNDCTSGWLITIRDFNGGERALSDLEDEIIDDIMQLIQARDKQRDIEARIDELSEWIPAVRRLCEKLGTNDVIKQMVAYEEQLKAELEALKKEVK